MVDHHLDTGGKDQSWHRFLDSEVRLEDVVPDQSPVPQQRVVNVAEVSRFQDHLETTAANKVDEKRAFTTSDREIRLYGVGLLANVGH